MKRVLVVDGIRSFRTVVAGLFLAATVTGCATTGARGERDWTPSPRVTWREVVPVTTPEVKDGFRLIKAAPTRGLFPASIGVTRVAYHTDSGAQAGSNLHLTRDPHNEFLQWNRTFDDQMAVSEVFPIDQRDLAGGEAEAELILAAFRALEARIGLIYAVNELAENETEMIGALYDVSGGEPLASIHASATSVPVEERESGSEDMWSTDSRALVRTAFAEHVYQCIRTLISRDQPAAVESPEGWTPAGPIMPVEWPPKF